MQSSKIPTGIKVTFLILGIVLCLLVVIGRQGMNIEKQRMADRLAFVADSTYEAAKAQMRIERQRSDSLAYVRDASLYYARRDSALLAEAKASYVAAFAPFGPKAYEAYPSGYSPNLGLFPYEKTVADSGTRVLTLDVERPGIYDIVVATQDGPDSLLASAVSPVVGCNTFVIPERFLPGRHFHFNMRQYTANGATFKSVYVDCLYPVDNSL